MSREHTQKNSYRMNKLLALITLLLSTSSCYKMPNDQEISVIPNTNNPNLTHQEQTPWLPTSPM